MEVMKSERAPTRVSRGSRRTHGALALTSLLLVTGVAVLVNILSVRVPLRLDLTQGNLNSLSPASEKAVRSLEDLEVRVFISPDLPEKVPSAFGSNLRPREVAERFRDLLEEYRASSGGNMRITWVTEDVLEEARTAKLPTFASDEAELEARGTLRFKEYVIGAVLVYGPAIERFPKQVAELQPGMFEFEITKRLLRLRDRVADQDAHRDVLDAGDGLAKAVSGCTDLLKDLEVKEAEKPLALGPGADPTAAQIAAYAGGLKDIQSRCGKIPAAVASAKGLAKRNEFLEIMVGSAEKLLGLLHQLAGALTAGAGGKTLSADDRFRAIRIPQILAELGKSVEGDHERLEETPGQRKIAFLCGHGAFCPFPATERKIRPELAMMMGQQNAMNRQILQRLQRYEEEIDATNQQIGNEFFRRRGYAIIRAKVGEPIPSEASALVIYAPRAPFSDEDWYPVDQFILSGKPVVVLAGTWDVSLLNPSPPDEKDFGKEKGLSYDKIGIELVPSNLAQRLRAYGVEIQNAMVMEPRSHDRLVLTVMQQVGGRYALPVRTRVPYPLLPRVLDLDPSSVLVRGLDGITLPYAAPIKILDDVLRAQGTKVTPLLRSSDDAVVKRQNIPIIPRDARRFVSTAEPSGKQVLAALVTGPVASAFAGKDLPKLDDDADKDREAKLGFKAKGTARMLVLGSNLGLEGLSADRVLGALDMQALMQNPLSLITKIPTFDAAKQTWEIRVGQLVPVILENFRFLYNVLDWASQQEELVEVRTKSVQRRPLVAVEAGTRKVITWGMIAGLPVVVSGLGLLGWAVRRRRRRRITL